MCLLSLPLEVLFNIIENPVLSNDDLGNLRIVHSTVNHILTPRLLHCIGFDFSKISIGGGRQQAIGVARRTDRLYNIAAFATNSQNTPIPRRFQFKVDVSDETKEQDALYERYKKEPIRDITTFTQAFIAKFPGILRSFTGIEEVRVKLNLTCIEIEDAEDLVETVCNAIGRNPRIRMDFHLMGLTSKRRSILHSLTKVEDNLESLKLVCAETRCLDGIVTDVGNLMRKTSRNIKSLELQNFGNTVGGIFAGFQKNCGIQTLRIVDAQTCTRKSIDFNESKIGNLVSLKKLELRGKPTLGPMIQFWKLLKKHPIVKLTSLSAMKLDNDLLAYLLDQNTIRDLKVSVDITHKCDSEPGNSLETTQRNLEQLANNFFNRVLPHMQGQLRSLGFLMESVPKRDRLLDIMNTINMNPPQHIHNSTLENKARTNCFSFGMRAAAGNTAYNFPYLESIHTWISAEDGSFDMFMKAIQKSPRLKNITLEMEVSMSGKLPDPLEIQDVDPSQVDNDFSSFPTQQVSYFGDLLLGEPAGRIEHRWTEIENYIIAGGGGCIWDGGLRLEVQERLGSILHVERPDRKFKRAQRKVFEFRNRRWTIYKH